MKKNILLILMLSITFSLFSQSYHFKFKVKDKNELKKITQIISIDNVKENTVWAYANKKEFEEFSKLNYKLEELPLNDNQGKALNMATTTAEMSNWDKYPTYDVYKQMMLDFQTNYPTLCDLDTIGTTQDGRLVLVLKISDNVSNEEAEPEFFYTSTMHGDEITGIVLLLRLADYLLSNYNTDTEVLNLVNNFEIFINPIANPDGTYAGGNTSVSGSVRNLANGDDPNRDFPYPLNVNSTTSNPETNDMKAFATAHNFVMSANFHGGAEVFNYTWDCWSTSENAPADANWWEHVGRAYVDTARLVNSSYMTDVTSDGVTEGADWYPANGTRQDYMNYFPHCKEVTIELSSSKTLSSDLLPAYWNYNKKSLINYIKEAEYGFFGTVKNTGGDPLDAKIEITTFDKDNSWVVTDPIKGDYYRPIEPGTYNVTYSCTGYTSQSHNITVLDWETYTIKDVILGGVAGTTSFSGLIKDFKTDLPINNAQLTITGENDTYNVSTDTNGEFSIPSITEGTYRIQISKSGYAAQYHFESISDANNNITKKLIPYLNVIGTIKEDGTGNPIEGAKIEFLNTSILPVYSDINGNYSVLEINESNYDIRASKTGYTAVIKNIDISTTTTVDFTLAISNAISFESEIPSTFTFGGDAPWTRVTPEAYDGDYSMKSGNITHSETSIMETTKTTQDGTLSFYKFVSSESGYDFLNFYIDDIKKDAWSGTSQTNWDQANYTITAGTHIYKWEYIKDSSADGGDDCAWVDYIDFPPTVSSVKNNLANTKKIKVSPNPFNESTSFEFYINKKSNVFVGIYSYNGQLVKTLLNNEVDSGNHRVIWNGTNNNKQQMANGLYFCKIVNNYNSITEKIILMK